MEPQQDVREVGSDNGERALYSGRHNPSPDMSQSAFYHRVTKVWHYNSRYFAGAAFATLEFGRIGLSV